MRYIEQYHATLALGQGKPDDKARYASFHEKTRMDDSVRRHSCGAVISRKTYKYHVQICTRQQKYLAKLKQDSERKHGPC